MGAARRELREVAPVLDQVDLFDPGPQLGEGRLAAGPAGMDTGQHLDQDHSVAGRVENAVRTAITPGDVLATPSGRGRFTVARYTTDSLVLLLGEKEAWTPLPWPALEEIPDLLRAHDWVLIGSLYSTDSRQGSLDEHLKRYLKRATAGWVAVVLEKAAVITIDRSRPAQIKLRPGW
jgi:hypothetical protein